MEVIWETKIEVWKSITASHRGRKIIFIYAIINETEKCIYHEIKY